MQVGAGLAPALQIAKSKRQRAKGIVNFTPREQENFTSRCFIKSFKRKEFLAHSGAVCNDIFFIKSGTVRLTTFDKKGVEYICYFVFENNLTFAYASFISQMFYLRVFETAESESLRFLFLGNCIPIFPFIP